MSGKVLTLEEAVSRSYRVERWILLRDPLGKVAAMIREESGRTSYGQGGVPVGCAIRTSDVSG